MLIFIVASNTVLFRREKVDGEMKLELKQFILQSNAYQLLFLAVAG